ncbi:MAG: PilZ domain-containing protein [Spongiibacteraceae bacterium]|jgi:hypothetical protein
MTTMNERRSHPRLPANHLRVLVKSLRSQNGHWKPAFISSVDFNRYGIGLETDHNFAIGDILSMIIRTDDATIAEINGLICNRTTIANGFRFGVRFQHQSSHEEESTEAVINISAEILMLEQQAANHIH